MSACVKIRVYSSATFYGKVSFPPLCSRRLPDTDEARGLPCSVCVRRGEQTLLVSESRTGRDRLRVSASKVKGRESFKHRKCPSASVDRNYVFILWLWSTGFDFERGGFRLGLANGASGSGELQVCMSWAASSHCQRTGDMQPRGQSNV